MQAIGCLWRQQQQKRVVVYRLLARHSPDEFLTHISSGNGVTHRYFLDSNHPALRKHEPTSRLSCIC